MSLVVEPAHAYTSTQLKLDDPTRWTRLFPLIRPSLKAVDIGNNRTVVVDTALLKSKDVLIAAIGTVGNFSSKILSESHIAILASEPLGQQYISAKEVVDTLKSSGFPTDNGIVVLKAGQRQDLSISSGLAEVSVVGELKLDHLLSLLANINKEIKVSLENIQSLLKQFLKTGACTISKFHEKKSGDAPYVVHTYDHAEFSSAKKAVEKDLEYLLDLRPLSGDVVHAIHCADINGLSRLENNILIHEVSEYIAQKKLASRISHSTILDNHSQARGWAISLCVVPNTYIEAQTFPPNTLGSSIGAATPVEPRKGTCKIRVSDSEVRKVITQGCESVMKAEPTITEYDTIVGDGDCGYTLRDGAKQVMSFIKNVDLSKLPLALGDLVDDLEVNMGGTSGALYCIFISSLVQELWTAATFADALKGALDHLLKYTTARLGDRTCLDCLIPFVETLQKTGDIKKALEDAEKGVETTKKLEAKLGRSSYLDDEITRGVPDPGAYGLLMLLNGMVAAKSDGGDAV